MLLALKKISAQEASPPALSYLLPQQQYSAVYICSALIL